MNHDDDEKTAGWWNDIHCTMTLERAYVCAYDNGILETKEKYMYRSLQFYVLLTGIYLMDIVTSLVLTLPAHLTWQQRHVRKR